jgi:hypothetical protein
MSDSSAYVGDKLLNWIRGTAMGAAPATIFASLWNGDPDSGGTQVTGTVSLTTQSITWTAVGSRSMSNSVTIAFGTASGSATVTYVVLADNATYASGNQIAKKLISSAAITNGQTVQILAGNLALSY